MIQKIEDALSDEEKQALYGIFTLFIGEILLQGYLSI